MQVDLPYGRDGAISVDVPDKNLLGILSAPKMDRAKDQVRAAKEALRNPVGTTRLKDMVSKESSVAVIVNDATRPNIEKTVAPVVMEELREGGVSDDNVIFVIANGAHRPATQQEITSKLGLLAERVKIVNHDAKRDDMVNLGRTSSGFHARINARVAKADVKMAIGTVLPHPIAGYSGGGKAIAVGVASSDTIASTHTVGMLDHPKTGLGLIEGNPFYEVAIEIARLTSLDFIVNCIVNEQEEIVDIIAGDVEAAHSELIQRTGRRGFEVAFPRPADIVIVSAGYPKDGNLYHVSAEGICVVAGSALPTPCVKKGGTIIVASPMSEGIYNQAFYDWLTGSPEVDRVIKKLKDRPITDPGQHRAYGVACVLRDIEVIIAESHLDHEITRKAHMIPIDKAQTALMWALEKHGSSAEVLVVVNSHRLIPIYRP
jgi:nickel-dependent lactate racemase